MAFFQYDVVRVSKLLHAPDHYNGWNYNQRLPAVGDVGTIVDILTKPNAPNSYVVECSSSDKTTIWLGDFLFEEIEAVTT